MKSKKQQDDKNSRASKTNEPTSNADPSGELKNTSEPSKEAEADIIAEDTPVTAETEQEQATAQKYNEALERYHRTLAEFDNYRKRTIKEKAVMYDDGVRDVVEKLLPVIDNFERALNAGENKEDKFYQGIVMIAKQLGAYLTELGVEPIAAGQGEAFNPNFHFAVAHVEDETLDTNVVIDELQKGYQYKDKVIRPSMVRVAN